jgi:acetyl-CoA acetyltransferase
MSAIILTEITETGDQRSFPVEPEYIGDDIIETPDGHARITVVFKKRAGQDSEQSVVVAESKINILEQANKVMKARLRGERDHESEYNARQRRATNRQTFVL